MMPMLSMPQQAKKNRVKVLMMGVKWVAFAATMAAMLIFNNRKKSKLFICGVIKYNEDIPNPCTKATLLICGSQRLRITPASSFSASR
ncbi:hypothetical protein D3C71_1929620 [compost metagenome]